MLAVIMADGQYTDDVTIIPCTYTKNVSLASQAYSDYVNATVQLQTLDRQCDNLHQTIGNLHDYIQSINEDHPKWQEYCTVKERINEHNGMTRKEHCKFQRRKN